MSILLGNNGFGKKSFSTLAHEHDFRPLLGDLQVNFVNYSILNFSNSKSVVMCLYFFAKFFVIMCLTRILKRWRTEIKLGFFVKMCL